MIDDKSKEKLLEEITKLGIVHYACMKVGIDRATYYRWKNNDAKFKKLANKAEKYGRLNFSDIAEFSLLKNVKGGDQRAVEFALSHISERYKRRRNDHIVTFIHKKIAPLPEQKGFKTLEELIADDHLSRSQELYSSLTKNGKEIPPKPDGSPIELEELFDYEDYIKDWQKRKGLEKLTGTADLKSETDKPQAMPPQNQKPLDS